MPADKPVKWLSSFFRWPGGSARLETDHPLVAQILWRFLRPLRGTPSQKGEGRCYDLRFVTQPKAEWFLREGLTTLNRGSRIRWWCNLIEQEASRLTIEPRKRRFTGRIHPLFRMEPDALFHFLFRQPMNLLLSADRCTFLHAASVARDGRGILLAGPSGVGKSILSLACARAGWGFLSDEMPILHRDGSGFEARAFPCLAGFSKGLLQYFPEVAARVAWEYPEPGRTGRKVRFDAGSVYPNCRRDRAPLSALIFPRYASHQRPQIRTLTRPRALEILLQDPGLTLADSSAGIRKVPGREDFALEWLWELVVRLPAYELTYRLADLDRVPKILARL